MSGVKGMRRRSDGFKVPVTDEQLAQICELRRKCDEAERELWTYVAQAAIGNADFEWVGAVLDISASTARRRVKRWVAGGVDMRSAAYRRGIDGPSC